MRTEQFLVAILFSQGNIGSTDDTDTGTVDFRMLLLPAQLFQYAVPQSTKSAIQEIFTPKERQ